MGVFGKIGSVLSVGGRFIGMASGAGVIVQIISSIWAYKSMNALPKTLSRYLGKYFDDMIEQNPAVMFFVYTFFFTLIGSILILSLYSLFKIRMGKKMKAIMASTPFILIICSIVYMGYRQNLRMKDEDHVIFANATTEQSYFTAVTQNNYSHREKVKSNPKHVHDILAKSLPDVVYKYMAKDLDKPHLSRLIKKKIMVRTQADLEEFEMNVTPLMYACYLNNIEAVKHLLDSGKVDVTVGVKTLEEPFCTTDYTLSRFGYTYKYTTRHTPYSVCIDNGNYTLANIIKKYCQENNIPKKKYNGSFTSTKKKDCSLI